MCGISPARLCFDPGIGFGKSVEHNLALLARQRELLALGQPLLVELLTAHSRSALRPFSAHVSRFEALATDGGFAYYQLTLSPWLAWLNLRRDCRVFHDLSVPQIIDAIGGQYEKTVFSFIPNTAETAYYGLMDGLRFHRRKQVREEILKAAADGTLSPDLVDDLILRNWPRGEKIAHKDIKLRTFISQEKGRDTLVSHVYDITYGIVNPGDYLVALDDSVVRGTTLKKSILKILARTKPAKIVVCSTAPQIRYPDCYGIDMSKMKDFVAFRAALALLQERGLENILDEVNLKCLVALENGTATSENFVKAIYEPFTNEEISNKIAEIVKPKHLQAEVSVIYQTVENLNVACPNHLGDWYFTGNFPTPGGNQVVNKAFVNFMKGVEVRAY